MTKPRSFAPIIAAIQLLLPVLYVGSYLASVQPTTILFSVYGVGQPQRIQMVRYRFGGRFAEQFFWPLEQIDRKLRPGMWESVPDRITVWE
jgi:hypothetical protein